MPTPYSPGGGQLEAQLSALGREELVRHLRQDAGAVAGQRIAAAGAAVRQIDQDLQARADDLMALLAAHVDDEADAAGVVLLARDRRALLAAAEPPVFGGDGFDIAVDSS